MNLSSKPIRIETSLGTIVLQPWRVKELFSLRAKLHGQENLSSREFLRVFLSCLGKLSTQSEEGRTITDEDFEKLRPDELERLAADYITQNKADMSPSADGETGTSSVEKLKAFCFQSFQSFNEMAKATEKLFPKFGLSGEARSLLTQNRLISDDLAEQLHSRAFTFGRPFEVADVLPPVNPAHETNKRLVDIQSAIEGMVEISRGQAELLRSLNDTSTRLLSDAASTAKLTSWSLFIAMLGIVIPLIISWFGPNKEDQAILRMVRATEIATAKADSAAREDLRIEMETRDILIGVAGNLKKVATKDSTELSQSK